MDKKKIKFITDTITDKDDLELGKSFQEMVKETVQHAFKEGIKANSIIINKDFIRVKKAWINNGFSCSELPDMICGLEVYLTDGDLPENYSFAVLERDKTERELLIERTRKETAEKFAERLKAMAYQSTDWSHGEHPMVVEVDYIDEICEEITEGEKEISNETI